MNWFKRLLSGRSHGAAVSARRSGTRLRLEELESRWVPSTLHTTTSTNWSGYAVSTANNAVTAVSASWTVPTTVTNSSSGTNYSSAWVGIDGYNSSTVEQTGTEMDVTNGKVTYSAWYEFYPSASKTITSIVVHPGDTIDASVKYNATTSNFTVTISDVNDGSSSFTMTQTVAGAERSSAEWIVEAPSNGSGILPLANFGSVSFTNAQATIGGATGPINYSAWAATVNEINMTNKAGTVIATTSSLTAGGTAFSVGFDSSLPTSPPPASPPPAVPPPAPPVVPPPTPAVGVVTSLTATVNPFSRVPSVTFVATVSAGAGKPLPTGSIEILDGNTVLGNFQIQDVNGVAEVVFTINFPSMAGVYNISVAYVSPTGTVGTPSNTITVTVS